MAKILSPPGYINKLGSNEYTDRTLSVGRSDGDGEDWSPTLTSIGLQMMLLKVQILGCL